MAIITLPPDVARQLREAGGKALLYDDHGRFVAEALPPGESEVLVASREMTPDEFEHVRRTGQGVRTAELLAKLPVR